MKRARVFFQKEIAGVLEELEQGRKYVFRYDDGYNGLPISLTMPSTQQVYEFNTFPPFFDGVLPEGSQLEALLRQKKFDRKDFFSQLLAVGADLVGAVTVKEIL